MNKLVCVLILLSFFISSFAYMAHAHASDHALSHCQMSQDNIMDNEPCHLQQDQSHDENGCDDCCCVHSHSMATSFIPNKTPPASKQQNIIASLDDHYSVELSGLKRPPRL